MRSQLTELVLLAVVCGGSACAEATLLLHRDGQTLTLDAVYLNGQGPFRMMIDTGNASSLIRPQVAQKLGVAATYRVEHVTSAGTRRVPVMVLDRLAVGSVIDRQIEAMIGPVAIDGVDGVLGQSWLVRHNYLLDYRNRRLVLDGAAPERAMRTSLRSVEGCPAIAARVDGVALDLVVDSGSNILVLFEHQPLGAARVALLTNGQSGSAELVTAQVQLGSGREQRMVVARVHSTQLSGGLLPADAFRAVYVSNHDGFVDLVR